MAKNNKIIIYKTEDEKVSVDVRFDNETVWLTQMQMAELFDTTKQNSFCDIFLRNHTLHV